MDYLKKYNLDDEQIKEIKESINNSNAPMDLFVYEEDKITKILDLFTSFGITNIYGIVIINPELFLEDYDDISSKINNYENKNELAELINEDANNLKLIGLY